MAPLSHFIALFLATAVLADLNALTYVGCFKSSNGLSVVESAFQYQSDGHCQGVCVNDHGNQPVLGLTGSNSCLCGSVTPATSDKVSDSSCNLPCTGYGQHMCGGNGFYSVYLTGVEANVAAAGGSGGNGNGGGSTGNAQAASATTNASPTVITSIAPGKTVIVTQSPNTQSVTASPSPAPKKSSHTAAVVGAVVGVVVVAAIAGALFFFFFRQRRRRAAEEEYKSHQVNDFMAGGGKPTIPAMGQRKPSGPDSRLDADAMAQRRMSDGSIADNEDYSRRILKVTNPDDRY